MRSTARSARLAATLGVALALALGTRAPAAEPRAPAAAAHGDLGERLAARLAAPGLRGARISALVVDAASGAAAFSRQPDQVLVPASNLKVLTAVAALAAFGPTHRFTTQVLAPAAPDATGGVDALYLRGGGDPALTSEQWWRLAADLRMAGVSGVRGDLVVDDALFDDVRWHPSWGDVSARAYHAPVGALMANYGSFRVTVTPGSVGRPASVALDPPIPYLVLDAQVSTAAGGAPEVSVVRVPRDGAERVVVRGSVPAGGAPVDVWRSVADPGRYAAEVARLQLAANGIPVEGRIRAGRAPEGALALLEFRGIPLAEIARLFLKHSNNVIAESLLKSLALAPQASPAPAAAAPGALDAAGAGWEAALRAERRVLEALGLDLTGATLVDGSGLSRDNRVSARLLVDALRLARGSFAFGPELVAAMPIAGLDGTLERRASAAAGLARAKTGLLTGATGLSGYARDGAGREWVFCVLANGYTRGDRAAMDALDGFVAALVR